MRNRLIISLALCLCLLLAGCAGSPADPAAGPTPAPEGTPQATAEAAPSPGAGQTPASPVPTAGSQAADATRAYLFGAVDGDTAYWCTGYGVLSLQPGGKAGLLSPVQGRYPVVMDGSLYVIEDQTDTTEEVAYPVATDAVTASRILRIPLDGGEAQEVYSAAYIHLLYGKDGRLFFSTTQGEGISEAGGLFSIDGSGQDEKLLAEDCIKLHCVQDGYAYFEGVVEETAALCRVPVAGGESEKLVQEEGIAYTPIAYQGDVYYVRMNMMDPEAEHNQALMRLHEGAAAPLGPLSVLELLGVWGGQLYYLAPPDGETALPSLARINLSTLESETVKAGVTEVAAISDAFALYSAETPLILAGELQLLSLAGGEPTALSISDAVESKG